MPDDGPVLAALGVSKRFPGVQALDNVSVQFHAGSCHALMGENGAGKSTLGKILAGLYRADQGEIRLNGAAVSFAGPLEARHAGINIVHQELLFCENLTVAENLNLAEMPTRGGFVDGEAMVRRATEWLARIGADVAPTATVGSLPIAKQQLVQIAGALGAGARILIFDEPTSALGGAETERLLKLITELKANGVACIYVSHRLDEVYEVCDTATVLRDGKFVETVPIPACDRDRLVSLMIGRSLQASLATHAAEAASSEPLLEVENLASRGRFEGVSLALRRGEILGIGGLVGAGRTEILEAIFGIGKGVTGSVRLNGRPLAVHGPTDAVRQGLGLVPEDRKRHGLVLSMNCRENISLPIIGRLTHSGFIAAARERAMALKYFGQMRVKAPSVDTGSVALSGGNQQKVVLAKWLGAECDVLLVDEPTRGVDVGAKAEIHALLRELAAAGKGVLVVSSELPELLALAHRIVIVREGRVVSEMPAAHATEDSLMRAMAGLAHA